MLGRKSIVIIVTFSLSSLLSLVGLLFMTNYLGPKVYGEIAWFLSAMASINSFADLGFNSAHIKKVSEGHDISDCFSTFVLIKMSLILGMVGLTVGILGGWVLFFGGELGSRELGIIALFVLYYVLYDISSIVTQTYIGRMESAKSQLLAFIDPLIRVPLIIFISINLMGAFDIAIAYAFTAIVVLLIAFFIFRRENIKWKKPTLVHSYVQYAMPLVFITVITALFNNFDKTFIGICGGNLEVAYFNSSQTLLYMVGIFGVSVAQLTFPSFSMQYLKGNIDEIRKISLGASRYISMISAPLVAILITFPSEVCTIILGSKFAPAADALRVLAIAAFISQLNQVPASQILAMNRTKTNAKIITVSFLIYIGLLIVLVPDSLFGLELLGLNHFGASLANLVMISSLFCMTYYAVHSTTGRMIDKRIFLHIFAAAVSSMIAYSASLFLPIGGFVTLLLFGAVLLALYLVILVVIREFRREDMNYILDVLNIKNMRSYLRDEFKKS